MKKMIKVFSVIIAAAALCCTTGCAAVFQLADLNNSYADSGLYTSGEREISDEIDTLDIQWTSGKVVISQYDGDTVSFKESCAVSLSEKKQVHSMVDRNGLHIRFTKSGERLKGKEKEKKLEVMIPKDMKLNEVELNGASCDYLLDGITSSHIATTSASGECSLNDCSADTVALTGISGSITVNLNNKAESIETNTTSGDIRINADTVKDVTVNTASGDVGMTLRSADSVSVHTVSGELDVAMEKEADEMRLESTSGEVTLSVPEKSDFTAALHSVSGELDSELSLTKDGSKYICGSGKNSVIISTTSGDIKIRKHS